MMCLAITRQIRHADLKYLADAARQVQCTADLLLPESQSESPSSMLHMTFSYCFFGSKEVAGWVALSRFLWTSRKTYEILSCARGICQNRSRSHRCSLTSQIKMSDKDDSLLPSTENKCWNTEGLKYPWLRDRKCIFRLL